MSEKNHERPLGFWSATGAVIATMIGAGIFGATGGFAHELGTDTNVLLVWLFRDGLALTGALSLASLLISLRHRRLNHPPNSIYTSAGEA